MSEIDALIKQGYCKVSNKFTTVARIDKENFLEALYIDGVISNRLFAVLTDYYKGLYEPSTITRETVRYELTGLENYYRRTLSKDTISGLDRAEYDMFPSSDTTVTGYSTLDTPTKHVQVLNEF